MTLSMPEKRSFSLPETVKKYGMQLFGFIRSRVKIPEDAEDILQDVWYQLETWPILTRLKASAAGCTG